MQIPICPISQLPMTDPVIDHEGNSYEKDSILTWLRSNPVSPITRAPLSASQLRPNRALKDFINSQSTPTQSESFPPLTEGEASPARFVPAATIENACYVTIGDTTQVAIKVKDTLESRQRMPIDIVCVIDVSSSMEAAATFKDQNAQTEDTGLSILDVVKHGLRTTVASLQSQDRMSLVTFSSSANTLCGLTEMTVGGKTQMNRHIEEMNTEDCTNIWEGIRKACDCYIDRDGENVAKNRTIFLFTDGLPNISPPRGELQTLKNHLDANHDRSHPFVLHTFGFGYGMNSKLLHLLAKQTGGTYSFIPDAGFVGTVMIHRLANLLSTVVNKAYLMVEKVANNEICQYPIGGLLLGQKRTFTLPFKICDSARLYVDGENVGISLGSDGSLWFNTATREMEKFRHEITTLLLDLMTSEPSAADLSNMSARVSSMIDSLPERCQDWKHDLVDQILKALSPEHHCRWGSHYIRSFARAHEIQQANNFKDESVQNYGGSRFAEERERLDKIFLDLPEVRPSRPTRTQRTFGGQIQTLQSPVSVSMMTYHSRSNVCVLEGALVHMSKGVRKNIENLRKGDVLSTGDIVDCLVVSKVDNPLLVEMKCGFSITPYHPVKQDENRWVFPEDSDDSNGVYVSSNSEQGLFSVLTCKREPIRIGEGSGIDCATLGHGDTTSPVIGHQYFGSNRVVDDIKGAIGYDQGRIHVKSVRRQSDDKGRLVMALEFY